MWSLVHASLTAAWRCARVLVYGRKPKEGSGGARWHSDGKAREGIKDLGWTTSNFTGRDWLMVSFCCVRRLLSQILQSFEEHELVIASCLVMLLR